MNLSLILEILNARPFRLFQSLRKIMQSPRRRNHSWRITLSFPSFVQFSLTFPPYLRHRTEERVNTKLKPATCPKSRRMREEKRRQLGSP